MRRIRVMSALFVGLMLVLSCVEPPVAGAYTASIAVDAGRNQGFVRPTQAGQMYEWALPNLNDSWAEKLKDRSFESDNFSSSSRRSSLYDAFTGSGLDYSRWTPLSLDAAGGSVGVSGSQLTVSKTTGGRYGVMSNNLANSRYAGYTVETQIVSYSGVNAILNLYAGTGAGDFTNYVEFAIESGFLKVYADGLTAWTGGAATVPAILRVEVSPLSGNARDLKFFYNGTQVYSITGFTKLSDPFRAFLYGWSGSAVFDYLNVFTDDTYDGFYGTSLAPRWTTARLEGSTNGTVGVSGGNVQLNGGLNSRYGILSDYIRNSALDWTTIDARLVSYTGTNALLNIYGGSGAGDFSKFVEFGVEGGVGKVYTADGGDNWSGGSVTLPATLTVKVSPYYSNGRRFKFYINGAQVHEIAEHKAVPPADFRLFLYGWSNSTAQWDYLNVSQRHMWDSFAPNFEGGPGLSVEWTPVSLEGSWGSSSQGSGQLTVNGAASSRYGALSQTLDESDFYDYTVEAKLDSYTGTNALLNIYAGTGRGNFTKYIEFGIEGGVLKVFGDGVPSWTGGAATTPALLRIEVGAWRNGSRNFYFFYNNRLVHSIEGTTAVPNQEYQAFLYGWGTSVTKWDYATWWKNAPWQEDGYNGRAVYSLDTGGYNGRYAQKVEISQLASGRKGISQRGIAVTAGRQYAVNVYLKQSGLTAPVTVYLGSANGDGSSYTPYASGSITSVSTGWTKYTVNLTPNTTDNAAKLFVGATGTGTFWLDMASVMPTDSNEVVYGGWRKDFVDRLTALKPVILRWPGGIIADWYHWQDGVGSRDNRPPMYFAQWDAQWLTNDVGTHEILELGQALGLTVTLNVNWGTGTSSEAANWVEYTNGSTGTTYGALRNTNGRATPWGIKIWEIGNETWGWWTPGWTSNAGTFANGYVNFRDAMHAKDSSLSYIGEGGDGNFNDQTWNQTMLQTAPGKLDHLAVHFYPPQSLPQNYNSSDVYNASVGSPAVIGDRLGLMQNMLTNDSNRQDVKLAVTEYNAMYFNEETRRTRSLEAGLQVAGMINLFTRRSDLVEINFLSTLVNFWDGGGIRLSNRGSFVTPSHEVMRLYGNHHGAVVVKNTVSSPTYNAPSMGNLPARSNVPYLDVTTTKAADGTKLYISVVNRHPTDTATTSLSLSNAGTIGGTATAYTLNSGSYLDKNSWQNPNLISVATSSVTGVGSSFSYTFPAHSYTVLVVNTGAAAVGTPGVIGRVIDSAGNGLASATVQVTGGGSATTDSDGYYYISAATGSYTLTASKSGFISATLYRVDVHPGGATALPLKLTT